VDKTCNERTHQEPGRLDATQSSRNKTAIIDLKAEENTPVLIPFASEKVDGVWF